MSQSTTYIKDHVIYTSTQLNLYLATTNLHGLVQERNPLHIARSTAFQLRPRKIITDQTCHVMIENIDCGTK